jgi:hypothetical protein
MNKFFTLFSGLLILLLSTALPFSSDAQNTGDEYTPEKIEAYKADVQNLVDFLEYSFNMLGNPKTTTRDKDVIINQSYAKIFMDADVQIEDDLDDNRETLINKDVQAYLKDIDFFFREAVFSLNVSSIDHYFNEQKELYFIVTLTRTLNGRTITGDSVSSNKERFIEVNYDDVAQDLRIASIYTTRIDEKDELFSWWNKLPESWRDVFGNDSYIFDTIKLSEVVFVTDSMAVAEYWGAKEMPVDTFLIYDSDTLFIDETEIVEGYYRDTISLRKGSTYRLLQRIASETEIDISENLNITSLTPLAQMGELLKVNCANTLVDDLSPLRNLINIVSLDCSGTAVTSLAPMQYSVSLKSLDIHMTRISDIDLIANLRNLEKLDFSHTPADSLEMLTRMSMLRDIRFNNTFVSELSPLQKLTELRLINCSGTYVKDIEALRDLVKLERLYLSKTSVSNLSPLSGLDMLQTIYLDSTNISSLQALNGLPKLEHVYCDYTGITGSKANKFMAENPNTQVIYESVALTKWWNSMSVEWQNIFSRMAELDTVPSKEQLHHVVKINSIDISGNSGISSLSPLKELIDLSILNCSHTNIDNLWPIADLVDLQSLDCSNTPIKSCDPISDLMNLEDLNISHTDITSLQCISKIKNLRKLNIEHTGIESINVFGSSSLDIIYADGTPIAQAEVIAFKKQNPECIVIYQTDVLQEWWNALSPDWQDIFSKSTGLKKIPDPIDLQRIVDLTDIDLSQGKDLRSLVPLQKLYMLSSLKMNNMHISDLSPLSGMRSLETLIISDNPIEDISAVAGLTNLKHLEFKNTPVDDLKPLAGLNQVEILNMAGTQIKKMEEVSSLSQLRQLSFYNTSIKSLSPLEELYRLEVIKCYNTKLREKKVKKFGESHPGCEIVFY